MSNYYIQEAMNIYVSKIKKYKDIADQKGVQIGIYQGGGMVSVGGVMYVAEMATSVNLRIGQVLYVALLQDMSKAVVLG